MAQNTHNNVLVVGGSSGIGLATAKLSLTQLPGANVIISSSNKDKLEKAVKDIKDSVNAKDSIVDYVVGDMSNFDTQHDDVESMLKAAVERFGGKIDHIVWCRSTKRELGLIRCRSGQQAASHLQVNARNPATPMPWPRAQPGCTDH